MLVPAKLSAMLACAEYSLRPACTLYIITHSNTAVSSHKCSCDVTWAQLCRRLNAAVPLLVNSCDFTYAQLWRHLSTAVTTLLKHSCDVTKAQLWRHFKTPVTSCESLNQIVHFYLLSEVWSNVQKDARKYFKVYVTANNTIKIAIVITIIIWRSQFQAFSNDFFKS